ncbi:EamA family transporter [Fictibacillus barbaricus]|uniref:DMT family transporter n=1 Tax=Fictibacillus barbaricus TaxID=182136 RepID=A0ABS2Z8K0_9BACL|nr:DMT family transporter [Fictibacillus barbaricus]MBN3544140.1 DMT family transporter [Fictibacillus barbaricus]GGB69256.1 multidrug transporter [Fictibacillus barbaricus]
MMQSTLTYKAMMLLAAIFLGLTATIVNYLFKDGYLIQDLTNVQYGFGLIIIWLLVLPKINKLRSPHGREWMYLIGTGVTGASAIFFYFQSLTMIPVSLSIILLFQFSWIITVIDIIIKKKMPSFEKWIGILFIFIGTIFAVELIGIDLSNIPLNAIGLGLLAAVLFALSLYLPEYISDDSSSLLRAAITLTVAAIVIHILYPPTYLTSGILTEARFIKWGLIMAVFGQVVPLLFMLISIPRIGGRMAGILGSIELPTTVFFALIILKEEVTWMRWLGVLLILVGIFISEGLKSRVNIPVSKG